MDTRPDYGIYYLLEIELAKPSIELLTRAVFTANRALQVEPSGCRPGLSMVMSTSGHSDHLYSYK